MDLKLTMGKMKFVFINSFVVCLMVRFLHSVQLLEYNYETLYGCSSNAFLQDFLDALVSPETTAYAQDLVSQAAMAQVSRTFISSPP